MWTLEALQEDYEITFVTAATIDWDSLNRAYGTAVKAERIRLLGGSLLVSTPAELQARIEGDIGQWRRLANAVGIQAQ